MIPHDAFYGMNNLRKISLADNKLTAIPSDTFSNNPEVIEIVISDNQIGTLPLGLFRNNKRLKNLISRNNQITKIETILGTTAAWYDFRNNDCVNQSYYAQDVIKLNRMNAELKRLC